VPLNPAKFAQVLRCSANRLPASVVSGLALVAELALVAAGSGLAGSTRPTGEALLAPRARLGDHRGHGRVGVGVDCAVRRR
jgi:hypothetical protein